MLRDIEFDLYEANANDFEEQCNLPDTPIEYFEQFLSYSDVGTGIRVPECFEQEKLKSWIQLHMQKNIRSLLLVQKVSRDYERGYHQKSEIIYSCRSVDSMYGQAKNA